MIVKRKTTLQLSAFILVATAAFTACKTKKESQHNDQYIIEIMAVNPSGKEIINTNMAVTVDSDLKFVATRGAAGDEGAGRYVIAFPAKVQRENIKSLTLKIPEFKNETVQIATAQIEVVQPPTNVHFGGCLPGMTGSPAEFDLAYLMDFLFPKAYGFIGTTNKKCEVSFRARDRIRVVFTEGTSETESNDDFKLDISWKEPDSDRTWILSRQQKNYAEAETWCESKNAATSATPAIENAMKSGLGKLLRDQGVKGQVWTWTAPSGFPPEEGESPEIMQVVAIDAPHDVTELNTSKNAYALCFSKK